MTRWTALAAMTACYSLLWTLPTRADPAAPPARSLEEIKDCLRASAPSESSIQTVTLRAVDRMGTETDSSAEIFCQGNGDEVLVRIHEPATRRGSALLMLQKGDRYDMWMYLPELRKVKRITLRSMSGSMFGTDLSYEDFERLQGLGDDANTVQLPDGEVDGREAYRIEIRPSSGANSAYERIVAAVEKARCMPVRLDLYETGDRLRKVMSFPADQIKETKKGYFPYLIRVEDRIDGTHTDVIVDKIDFDVKIPRSYFSQSNLAFGK